MKGKTVCTILNKIAQTSNKYDDYSNFQRTHTPHSSSPISTSTSKPTSSLPYQRSQQPTTHTRPRIQTRITAQFSNDFVWVGSKIKKPIQYSSRIWSQNISNISTKNNFSGFLESLYALHPYNIEFLSLTETRLNASNPFVRESIEAIAENAYPSSKSLLSNTKLENNSAPNQHGGSLSIVHGTLGSRYATKRIEKFGRYQYQQFYGKKHHLRIYTVYRPVQHLDSSKGDTTVWADHRYLLQKNKISTEPRQHLIESICSDVIECQKNNTQVLILGDFNEDIFSQKLNDMMLQAGLQNVIPEFIEKSAKFRTYNLGSKVIDGAWVTPAVKDAITSLSYAPFQFVLPSDHRPLIIDINLKALLDDYTPALIPPSYRRLKSSIPKRVNIYTAVLSEKWDHYNISLKLDQIEQRFQSSGKTPSNLKHLINIDNQTQQLFNHAESRCSSVHSGCTSLFTSDLRTALRSQRQIKCLISKEMMSLNFKTYTPKIKQLTEDLHQANIAFREHNKHKDDFRSQHMDDCVAQALRDDPNSKKASIIKQLKHIELQRNEAQHVDKTLNGYRDGALSYVLIPAISEYPDHQQSSPEFNHKNINTMWNRITPSNGKDIHSWDIIDQQNEVEHLTLECMKLHFSQANNTPLTSDVWIHNLMHPTIQKSILEGKYDLSSYPKPMQIFFDALKIEHENDSLPFSYSLEEFKHFIKGVREKTSSSPSGRHYGHFKVMLKYLPNVFSDVHRILSLCMKYNIFLPRYCKTVTTLIAKEPGMPKIHRLRPIHLVEIEVQAIAKSQWSKKLIKHAERKNLITDSQYGGRAGRQAQSAVLNKVLAFDTNNLYARDYTSVDEDLKANFDRELSHLGAIEDQFYGAPPLQGDFLHQAISSQEFFIKTKYGISDGSYSFADGIKVWGLGQGIGWAGSRWCLTSSTIARAMDKHSYGLKLHSPDKSVFIQKILDMFVDDTSQICNTFVKFCLMEQTRRNLQLHSPLVFVTGGLIVLDKCSFYHVKFEFDDDGNPKMLTLEENPSVLQIRRTFDETVEHIKQMDPNSEHLTLGYFIAPSGSNVLTLEQLSNFISEWATKVRSSTLSEKKIFLSYDSVLRPQLQYRLVANSLTFEECDKLFRPVFNILINASGIQRHMHRTLARASELFAGLNITHLYDLHGTEKLKFFFVHLRRFDNAGKLIFILMQLTQLYIGSEKFFMNENYASSEFLSPPSWIKHLWKYTSDNEIKIDLTHKPTLPTQRLSDKFIMDVLNPYFSPSDLFRINKIRLHMQVYLLSEISTLDGLHILPDIENGVTNRSSKYEWPRQPLVKKYLKLWKHACKILRELLSTNPLGPWTNMHQTWKWKCTTDEKYLMSDSQVYNCVTSGRRKKFQPISTPPPDLDFCNVADVYTYHSSIILISTENHIASKPKALQFDYSSILGDVNIPRSITRKVAKLIRKGRLIIGSDGSEKEGIAHFAWGLLDLENMTTPFYTFKTPVHGDVDQATPLRAEILGLFACFQFIDSIISKYRLQRYKIPVYSDCQNAILAAITPFFISCKSVFNDDGDIRAELRTWYKRVSNNIHLYHVKSHQNNTKPLETLSPAGKLNVFLDKILKAVNYPTSMNHERMIPHLPIQKVSLRHPEDRITNNLPRNITRFSIEYEAEQIISRNWSIDQGTMSSIAWNLFSKTMSSYPRFRKFAVSKFAHNQWPILEREHAWNRATTPNCPLCTKCIETKCHVFQCQESHVKAFRLIQLETLDTTMKKLDTHPILRRQLMRIIRQYCSGFQIMKAPLLPSNPDLPALEAINDQINLTVPNLLRGMILRSLTYIQQAYISTHRVQTSNIQTWGTRLIQALQTFLTSIWIYCCDVVHQESRTIWKNIPDVKLGVCYNISNVTLFNYLMRTETSFTNHLTFSRQQNLETSNPG